jgi:hypothetical protein
MDNIFQKFEHGVEDVAKDLGHVVVEVVEFPAKLEAVRKTADTEYPELKADIAAFEQAVIAFGTPGLAAVTSGFTNVSADITAIQDVPTLLAAGKRLYTDVEAAYAAINADVQ